MHRLFSGIEAGLFGKILIVVQIVLLLIILLGLRFNDFFLLALALPTKAYIFIYFLVKAINFVLSTENFHYKKPKTFCNFSPFFPSIELLFSFWPVGTGWVLILFIDLDVWV